MKITADSLTDEQIAARVKEALARFERRMDTQNDREFVRLYKTVMLPQKVMHVLSAEDHAEVAATRARLAEIINAECSLTG